MAATWRAGQLLEPDDVTFAVMMRGYGDSDPPQWTAISALLGAMQSRFQMKPSTGAATHGRRFALLDTAGLLMKDVTYRAGCKVQTSPATPMKNAPVHFLDVSVR